MLVRTAGLSLLLLGDLEPLAQRALADMLKVAYHGFTRNVST